MKRCVSLWLVILLAIGFWSLGPASQKANALTLIQLSSPTDSTKVTTSTPTFKWTTSGPASVEIKKKFQIQLATDVNFNTIVWDDTTILGTATSKVYDGAIPLVEWTAYYWRMRVQVDSIRVDPGDTINYWQEDYSLVSTFFYTTATLINVPDNVPTIQGGIYWSAAKDTVLVERGIYYENVKFHKAKVLLTSNYLFDQDTATINHTIIDGSKLTRGQKNGSVVYFSSAVDSNSTLMGFTTRKGSGTELETGTERRTCGGGIFCDVGSSPTIKYNVITENHVKHDGGGIFINAATPNILYNMIIDNSATEGTGGGIECRFSIEVAAAPGQKRDAGGEDGNLSTPATSRNQVSEEEAQNSLNPRDATEVFPVNAPPSLAKTTDNTPPVAIFQWYARKDTLIQRDKYLPGDTLFFDGTDSYDPDGGEDRITWEWLQNINYRCERNPSTSFSRLSTDSVTSIAITEDSRLGILKMTLVVRDTLSTRVPSQDTIIFDVQYPPHVDAGDDFTVATGDTAWLDGSASCDINLTDVPQYAWTQVDGPATVTIQNAGSAVAYFIPEGDSCVGLYEFQLKVSDDMASDSESIEGAVSNPPVPICQNDPVFGDTMTGNWTVSDTIWLDGCDSYDPDPGDQIVKYVWESAGRWNLTKNGWERQILPSDSSNNCLKAFKYSNPYGGLWKFRLRVRDGYGITSTAYDSVLYSVQLPPIADAGRDTVFRSLAKVWQKGRAIETNPDQRATMKYQWFVKSTPPNVSDPTFSPSAKSDSISFTLYESGVYVFQLQVDDGLDVSTLDEVTLIANKTPDANVVDVNHAFEGHEVLLDASSSVDPDSETYGKVLSYAWTLLEKPPAAETPVIVNANQSIASFVPYGTGAYQFKVVVHDTLSKKQPYYTNVDTLYVNVDSTFAYSIIKGNLISGNYAGSRGGGVDCNESSPDIFGNVFYKNQCSSSGGAICVRNFSTPQIKDNIFFGNVSSDATGGAIADLKGELAPSATRGYRKKVTIQNNDFWDNGGGTMYDTSGDISGNIYDYPRLVNPEFGDFTLECSSPCETLDIGKLVFFQPCDNLDQLSMVSLSMFQNPVATSAAHFVLNTDAPLMTEPVAYVEVGDNAPSPVYFTPVSPRCFRGSFVFTSSGDAKISVLASSVLEVDTTTTQTFGVQLIPADRTETLSSPDEKVRLTFPQGSVEQDIYATCISVSKDPQYDFTDHPDLEAYGEPYQLGPSISFERDLTVGFPLSDLKLEDKDKTLFSVYRHQEGKWNRVESYLEGNLVCADVRDLGVYRLVYDPTGKHITGRPTAFALYQNYPNPFNPETQIKYDLPASGHVSLTIYNVLGQRVKVLVDEFQDSGRKSVIWDGHDDSGDEVATGIYFYKIKADSFEKTRKMVLIK